MRDRLFPAGEPNAREPFSGKKGASRRDIRDGIVNETKTKGGANFQQPSP